MGLSTCPAPTTWVSTGSRNGGQDLEQSPNASAKQAGHVEDKQWTADGGGPVYYQQQVLATVPRKDIGSGF